MDLIHLLVVIIVLGLIFYLLYWLIGQMPLPEPFRAVAIVILGLAAVLILIGLLTGSVGVPVLRLR